MRSYRGKCALNGEDARSPNSLRLSKEGEEGEMSYRGHHSVSQTYIRGRRSCHPSSKETGFAIGGEKDIETLLKEVH